MRKPNNMICWMIMLLNVSVVMSLAIGGEARVDQELSRPDVICPPLPELNYKPVIGILSHPRKNSGSYIYASYVKFVETGGARVIPLLYDEPWSVLSSKLELVNGVLFTGGTRQYGPYVDVVRKIFEKVKEKNDAGDHFPCYAINLGFELLLKLISGNNNVLEDIDAQNLRSNLQLVRGSDIHGTVIGSFPLYLRNKLKTECLVSLNHKYGISKDRFDNDEQLSSFFQALTTCEDRNHKIYVSTIQARDYPIIGFQWNPEKNAFEWGSPEIPHSLEAIQVTQQTANYFISEARKSRNQPPAELVLENLIYNYNTVFTGADGKGFDETYYFDAYSSSSSTAAFANE